MTTDVPVEITDHRPPKLRAMTRSCYDLQKLRIATGLRLCANFRNKLGQKAGVKEEDLEEDAQKVIKVLRQSFARITDGIAKNRTLPPKDKFVGDNIISEYTEAVLVSQYIELEKLEVRQFGQLESELVNHAIYNEWLSNVVGVGPAMAAVIISEIDIHKARYPSSLWAYAGIDVAPDGAGRSRRKQHLVKRAYIDKDGEPQERDSVTFNPFLKTKLVGVLGGSFLRTGSPYAEVYRNYKHRLETDPAKSEWTKAHRHAAAVRYAVKIFLLDLHINWRRIEGLPGTLPYHEAKLGLVHRQPRAA